MPQKTDSFTADKRSNRRRALLALGVVAGIAVYNQDAIRSNFAKSGPNDIEYDSNGKPMYLMKGQQLESFLQAQDNAVSLANTWDTSIMPYQFWTKRTARGENRGRGLQAGSDYFVFKSYEDKYLSRNDGGHMKHKDQTNSQIKFQYRRVQSSNDGQVGIRAYNNKYMRCDGKKLYCDRDNLSHDEIFYIYQTSDCTGTGVPEGDACVALKALNGEQGSWVFPSDDNWVWCDGESADYKAKWSGWNTEGWTVDSMVYDFDAAT